MENIKTKEGRLANFNVILPRSIQIQTIGNYSPCFIDGKTLYVSGQLAKDIFFEEQDNLVNFSNPPIITGNISTENEAIILQAQYAAKMCAIQILYVIKSAIGDLENLDNCLQLSVFVSSGANFHKQHIVANGASDFLNAIMQQKNPPARIAIGVSALPLNSLVEVSATFKLK